MAEPREERHYLTITEFEREMSRLHSKLDAIAEQRVQNEKRLTALETNQLNAGKVATWLSGIVAALVSGLFGILRH
jgi:hypothetical protein